MDRWLVVEVYKLILEGDKGEQFFDRFDLEIFRQLEFII